MCEEVICCCGKNIYSPIVNIRKVSTPIPRIVVHFTHTFCCPKMFNRYIDILGKLYRSVTEKNSSYDILFNMGHITLTTGRQNRQSRIFTQPARRCAVIVDSKIKSVLAKCIISTQHSNVSRTKTKIKSYCMT